MSKSKALILSITLALLSSGTAMAQYQPGGLNGRENDELDAVYDRINELARQRPKELVKPVTDQGAYDQFMNQTGANLAVEQANIAARAAARQKDALTTGAYEQKRINDLANWERSQAAAAAYGTSRRSRSYVAPVSTYNNNAYPYGAPATAQQQAIETRRARSLATSQENVESRLQDSQAQAQAREQALRDSAENLRDQILNTQSSSSVFGLQGVGTNLYVRQYARPDMALPPVHNAAARIVPLNGN